MIGAALAAFGVAKTAVGGFLGRVWPKIVAGGALALAVLGVYAAVRKSGRDAQRADELARTTERQREIQDAEARGPRNRDDVAGRLRDGTF